MKKRSQKIFLNVKKRNKRDKNKKNVE